MSDYLNLLTETLAILLTVNNVNSYMMSSFKRTLFQLAILYAGT